MGCCSARFHGKIIPTELHPISLSALREEVLSNIFSLHNLTLACNSQIENYLISGSRDSAFLLKCKKTCIKEKLKSLQELVSKIDSIIENNLVKKSEFCIITQQMAEVKNELRTSCLFDENLVLEKQNAEYFKRLEAAFSGFDIDKEHILIEVDIEISDYKSKVDENRTGVRRRYVKGRNSV